MAAQLPAFAGSAVKSNLHQFNLQLRQQIAQLHRAVREGRITKSQAQERFEKLKALRKKELDLYRQNGHQDITAGQKDQLAQELSSTDSSL